MSLEPSSSHFCYLPHSINIAGLRRNKWGKVGGGGLSWDNYIMLQEVSRLGCRIALNGLSLLCNVQGVSVSSAWYSSDSATITLSGTVNGTHAMGTHCFSDNEHRSLATIL